MSYQVNLEGLDTLRSAAWTQHEYTSAGQGFATGSCGPGAFDTGVLWLFRGEYDAAYSMLSTAMDSAVRASQRVHDTLAANLQTYLDDDAESSASLTELGLTIEALPTHEHGDYRPQEPMSNPSLSDLNPYLTGPEKVLKEAIDEIDTTSILQNPVEFPGGTDAGRHLRVQAARLLVHRAGQAHRQPRRPGQPLRANRFRDEGRPRLPGLHRPARPHELSQEIDHDSDPRPRVQPACPVHVDGSRRHDRQRPR